MSRTSPARALGGRAEQAAMFIAAAKVPVGFQRTLMPRTALDQGLVSGVSMMLDYSIAAHERGALVLVDASQAVEATPVDVRALDVDFLVGGTLKYLLSSAGLAFLYCRRDLTTQVVPTTTGWFADEDIFAMDISDYSPHATARRFDSRTPPVPNIYAGLAGVGLMTRVGIAATEAHVRGLNDRLIPGLTRSAPPS